MIDLNENGSRLMQLSLKTVYINLPEYIVNGFDLTDHCCDIFYNLFIRQMIGTEKLLYIISVNKFFLAPKFRTFMFVAP